MTNKNKVLEFEESIEKSAKNLSWTFDLFSLALEEMKKSFSNVFWITSKQNEYFISSDVEKFEKNWLKNYKSVEWWKIDKNY